jgi:hypothetical protein
MRNGTLLLGYVAALTVCAVVAWQFHGVQAPLAVEDSYFNADTLHRMAQANIDVPEHLYPEDAYVDDLTATSRRLGRFRPDYTTFKAILGDPAVRLYRIEDDIFSLPPFLVGLKAVDGKYTIFTAKGAGGADASPMCEKPIDAVLGARVVAAWEKVLLETRPTTKRPYSGADGAFSHFGLVSRSGLISGKMWTPPKPFKPGWLEMVAVGLSMICDTGKADEMETALRAIETAK